MFGISGGEFLVLVVVAIIFLGPKHAAQAVRAVRNAMGYIRDFSSQLRSQVSAQHAQSTLEGLGITEEDLAALRKLRATTGSLDPRAFVRKTVAEEMDAWLDVAPNSASTTNGFPKNAYQNRSNTQPQEKTASNDTTESTPSTVSANTDKPVESDTGEAQVQTADQFSQESVHSPTEERKES